jgi:hypothetical protein
LAEGCSADLANRRAMRYLGAVRRPLIRGERFRPVSR